MFHRFHTGTWQRRPSGHVPTRFIPVRVARATVTMAVLRICALLLLFDCQEAFHCCLVVACINRINMISIECHRSGERCPGKREFDNRIEINRVRSGEIMCIFPLNRTPHSLTSLKQTGPRLATWEVRITSGKQSIKENLGGGGDPLCTRNPYAPTSERLFQGTNAFGLTRSDCI